MTLQTSAPVPFIEQYERFISASAKREKVLSDFYAQARAELNTFLHDPPVPLTASEQAFYGAINNEVKRLSAQALADSQVWAQNIPASFVEGALQHSPGMAFNIVHDNATRALSGYTLNLITAMSADMRRVVQQQIGVGLLTGATRQVVSDRIIASGLTNIPHWRTVETRAAAIARTELMRAYNAGNLAGIADTGAVAVRWITGQDERVCPICGPRHGKVFRAPGVVTDDPQALALPTVDVPPAHVKCRCTIRAFYGALPGVETIPTPPPGGAIEQTPTPVAPSLPAFDEVRVREWQKFSREQLEASLKDPRLAGIPTSVKNAQVKSDLLEALERVNGSMLPSPVDAERLMAASTPEGVTRATVEWAREVWGTKTGPFFSKLSPLQMDAATRYSGKEFARFNKFLRKGQGGSKALQSRIDALHEAINMTAIDRDIMTVRGTTISAFDRFDPTTFVGKTITERGFLSTSTKKSIAGDFGGFDHAVNMKITAPKGTRAMYMDPVSQVKGEQELLFGPGHTLRIDRVVRRKIYNRFRGEYHTEYDVWATIVS